MRYKKFFIAGGTGFVGKHLCKALKEDGCSLKLLVRSEKKAEQAIAEGYRPHLGDITRGESLKGALNDVDVVVNLVGLIQETPNLSFHRAHVEGTFNLIEESKNSDVKLFFYQSALGADLNSTFKYSKTKAEAEEIVKASGIPYIIFRPSLIIGKGDGFTKSLLDVINRFPFIPVPGKGEARFQPLSINDWVQCFLKAMTDYAFVGKTIEFGGPEHLTYNEILRILMATLGISKPIMHIPKSFVKAGLPLGKLASFIGIKTPSITSEQIELLQVDNITRTDSIEKHFGFKPMSYKEALKISLA